MQRFHLGVLGLFLVIGFAIAAITAHTTGLPGLTPFLAIITSFIAIGVWLFTVIQPQTEEEKRQLDHIVLIVFTVLGAVGGLILAVTIDGANMLYGAGIGAGVGLIIWVGYHTRFWEHFLSKPFHQAHQSSSIQLSDQAEPLRPACA